MSMDKMSKMEDGDYTVDDGYGNGHLGYQTPPLYTVVLSFTDNHTEENTSLYTIHDSSNTSQDNSTSQGVMGEAGGELVPCGLFFFIVYGPLFCAVCLFGLVGNALSFLVLHKYSRDTVATFLLKALAVSDNLFLATASFVQVYPAMAMYFGLVEQLEPIYPYLQIYAWPVAHMVQMGSVYMMILVAANRYIAVCKPLQAQRLYTKRQVYIQILIMTVAIIVYNIPRFFEYRYVPVNTTLENNITVTQDQNVGLVTHLIYNIIYENIAYLIFVFLIPLLVLTVFNAHLVLELRRASESRKAIASGKTREENNITLVMIVIILSFILCQTPASLNQVLYYTIGNANPVICTNYERFYHLCNLFITFNSSTNFFVYCLFRRQFQQELWALLCCYATRGKGRRPLRRTLILRALHQHNSFSQSFSKSFRSSTKTTEYSTQMTLLRDSPQTEMPGCQSARDSGKLRFCNGTENNYNDVCDTLLKNSA